MAIYTPGLPYGDATLVSNWHAGTVEVERADDRIGVHHDVWAAAGPEHRVDDQTLVLDTVGEYRYRLVGEVPSYTDPTQTVLVFERITDDKQAEHAVNGPSVHGDGRTAPPEGSAKGERHSGAQEAQG